MQRDEIVNQLTEVFHTVFNDTTIELSDEMTADDYDAWDSLNHINLILQTEAHFKAKFSNAEIARLRNVGDLINLLERKVS